MKPLDSAIIAPNHAAAMTSFTKFPESQGELIKWARGTKSQAEFARDLCIDRTCLSRYETEKLGAPTTLINHCLRKLGHKLAVSSDRTSSLEQSLAQARSLVGSLERAIEDHQMDVQ